MDGVKRALRRELRNTNPGDIRLSDMAIYRNLLTLPEYHAAAGIFCYYSIGSEPDTHRIIGHALGAGKRVFLPRILGKGVMEAVEIRDLQDLRPGRLNIPEPVGPATDEPMKPGYLLLVPGLAFSRDGHRLGQGGGYYDRYLAASEAVAVGLCRARFLMDTLPLEPHDISVHVLVTDKEIARP